MAESLVPQQQRSGINDSGSSTTIAPDSRRDAAEAAAVADEQSGGSWRHSVNVDRHEQYRNVVKRYAEALAGNDGEQTSAAEQRARLFGSAQRGRATFAARLMHAVDRVFEKRGAAADAVTAPVILLGTGAGRNAQFKVKGHASTPSHWTLARAMASRGLCVIGVDEYLTSSVCPYCDGQLTHVARRSRCTNSACSFGLQPTAASSDDGAASRRRQRPREADRDRLACIAILRVFLCSAVLGHRPAAFSPSASMCSEHRSIQVIKCIFLLNIVCLGIGLTNGAKSR